MIQKKVPCQFLVEPLRLLSNSPGKRFHGAYWDDSVFYVAKGAFDSDSNIHYNSIGTNFFRKPFPEIFVMVSALGQRYHVKFSRDLIVVIISLY